MAVVTIDGIYLGANVKTSTFNGIEKSSVMIDVYQPESEDSDKSVQVKCDDLTLLNTLNKDYIMGVPFTCKVNVNAYQNKAYYKLVKLG